MSNASPRRLRRVDSGTVRASVESLVRAVGFWTAVALPFVMLVVLVTGGAQRYPLAFVSLLAANMVALVLGRNYDR
jgi:hypothetical protein